MKNIRKQLGLSQTELAGILEVSVSQVSMCEKGIRNLNPNSLTELSQIELLLQKEISIEPADKIRLNQQKANVSLIRKLQKQIQHIDFECLKIQNRLEKLKSGYTQTEKLWSVINLLKPQTPEQTAKMAYLNLLEINCLKKMETFGYDQQALLEHQLNLLKQEQEASVQLIDSLIAQEVVVV